MNKAFDLDTARNQMHKAHEVFNTMTEENVIDILVKDINRNIDVYSQSGCENVELSVDCLIPDNLKEYVTNNMDSIVHLYGDTGYYAYFYREDNESILAISWSEENQDI